MPKTFLNIKDRRFFMDSIVLRLSEIEDAAQAILKDTETKKERLNQEFEERKDRYDQKQEALVNQRLSSIRSSLEDKTKQILTIQDQARCQEIEALQKEYDTNHTLYATQILKKITEV